MDDENQETFARHAEAGRLIALARSMLNADRDSLAVTYLDLAVSAISSSNAVTAVNRRANGTPYRRAKGAPLRDGAGLIGHAPLRCARRREGGEIGRASCRDRVCQYV